MSAIITWLLAEALPLIFGAAGVAAGLFGLYRSGKSRGRAEAKQEQQVAQSEQRRKVNEADTRVVEMGDADIRRELERWVRPTDTKDR